MTIAKRKISAMKTSRPTISLQTGKKNPGEPTCYYEVKIHVGDKIRTATFYKSVNGEFDLLYGFGEYTHPTAMYPTLKAAMTAVHQNLQKENPGTVITLGQPNLISEGQAKKKSHLYKPSAS